MEFYSVRPIRNKLKKDEKNSFIFDAPSFSFYCL